MRRSAPAPHRIRSSIPRAAIEHVVSEYKRERSRRGGYSVFLRHTQCRLNRKVVGERWYEEDGTLIMERPLKNGTKHGIEYRWYEAGKLHSAEPFVDGVAHGTAKQWAYDGSLMGTYTLVHGTGLDVWRNQRCDGTVYVSEIWPYRNGELHGFGWRLNEDQSSVCFERHWNCGMPHGIHREWNFQRRIHRGFPKYYIHGKQVTKRQYLRAAAVDSTLPPFHIKENRPRRVFLRALCRKLGISAR